MSNKSILNEEVFVPDFKSSIPSNRGEVFKSWIWRVSYSRNPIGVIVLGNSPFTETLDVPKLDVFFNTTREDETTLWGETAGENFFGMS